MTGRARQSGLEMSTKWRLPTIFEDGSDLVSPITPQTQNHPLVHPYILGVPQPPPFYNHTPTSLARIENKAKPITNRGGWKRLWLLILILIFCILGLTAGLIVGLRKRSNSNDPTGVSSSGPDGSTPTFNTSFPVGSFMIKTYLESISTSCTSNPATWLCYPYITYAESPNSSIAIFDWIIQPESQGSGTYIISSTNNPFSPIFTNITLALLDASLTSERYTFQIAMNKPVIPVTAVTDSNLATTCYYNSTTFEASLYTKMTKSNLSNSTDKISDTTSGTWPYAAEVEQIALSGPNVPYCVNAQYDQVGDFVVRNGQYCNCVYRN